MPLLRTAWSGTIDGVQYRLVTVDPKKTTLETDRRVASVLDELGTSPPAPLPPRVDDGVARWRSEEAMGFSGSSSESTSIAHDDFCRMAQDFDPGDGYEP